MHFNIWNITDMSTCASLAVLSDCFSLYKISDQDINIPSVYLHCSYNFPKINNAFVYIHISSLIH